MVGGDKPLILKGPVGSEIANVVTEPAGKRMKVSHRY
jgi:hypothetical protein